MASNEALRSLFEFSENDLEANRSGRLSDAQRVRFRQQVHAASLEKAAVSLTLFMLPLGILAFSIFGVFRGVELGPWVLLVLLVLVLLLVFPVSGLTRRLLRRIVGDHVFHPLLMRLRVVNTAYLQTIDHGQVTRLVGQITFPSDGEHQFVMIGEVELTSDVAADEDERLWKLTEGRSYALYTVPETGWIVSAELLADA